ncbi:hypothetical protein JYT87_00250 [Nitrospira defluvii]|nr:hypothetical protein [Nitrospira defluvii]
MRIVVFADKLTHLQTNLLVVSCFEDIRPLQGLASEIDWIYGGILSRVLMEKRFSGEQGEMLLLASEGKLQIPKIILVGLGISTAYTYTHFASISNQLHHVLKDLNISECAVEIDAPMKKKLDSLRLVAAFIKGEKTSKIKKPLEVTFIVEEREKAQVEQQYIHKKMGL